VWVNDGQKIEWDDAHGDQKTVDEKARTLEGYQLFIECIYNGDTGQRNYAKLWTKWNTGWWLWYGGSYSFLHQKLMECSPGQRPVYVNFYEDRPSQKFVATWRDHGGVVWDFTASADSVAFQADIDRMRRQGFRIDTLTVR
jgi:hypothetical protein